MKKSKKKLLVWHKKSMILANQATLQYFVEQNPWLDKVLVEKKIYGKFIKLMSRELESYQRVMYKWGWDHKKIPFNDEE